MNKLREQIKTIPIAALDFILTGMVIIMAVFTFVILYSDHVTVRV